MGRNNPNKPAAEWPEWARLPVTEYCRLFTPWPLHYLLNPKQLKKKKCCRTQTQGIWRFTIIASVGWWEKPLLAPSRWGCDTAGPRAAASRASAAQCWEAECRRQPSFLGVTGLKGGRTVNAAWRAQWNSKQGRRPGGWKRSQSWDAMISPGCAEKWSPIFFFNLPEAILMPGQMEPGKLQTEHGWLWLSECSR